MALHYVLIYVLNNVIIVFPRLAKEKKMYEKEVVDQQKKIEKMKEEGKDEHDVKKQVCRCDQTLFLFQEEACPILLTCIDS